MPQKKCVFNDRLKESYKCFVDGLDVSEAKFIICGCYVSVANKGMFSFNRFIYLKFINVLSIFTFLSGTYDLKAHLDTTNYIYIYNDLFLFCCF